jgi:hypothetical protein
VNISDEQDLAGRLDQAFQAITPREAPLDQAVRHGTVIRVRRRLAAAAGVAVVAAGIAVPVLLNRQAPQPVLNQPRYHVTVHPAGPHSPAGLIASGTADGRRWTVIAGKPGTGGQCFTAVLGPTSLRNCGTVTRPAESDPVVFMDNSDRFTDVEFGPVSAAVSYVTVRLADGPLLTLHPVPAYGTRYIAFAVPAHAVISKITAYSARGEIASTVPFPDPDGTTTISLWLRPGQTGLPRATHLVGSGTAGGRAWSVTAYVGPWGECLVTRGSGSISGGCVPASAPRGTSVIGSSSGTLVVVYGSAAADVKRVVITLAGGRSIRVPAIQVGTQKFFAFAHGNGQHPVRWQSYNTGRHQTGSGHIPGD